MTVASYRCEIDWNNDGDYLDTGEDVSARVRGREGIKYSRGRDQIRTLAPPMAGKLSLTLDNASRDYSPENAGGPLYGSLLPGRGVRVWGSVVTDSFDRADDGAALGSPDMGSAWSAVTDTWGISGNLARCVTSGGTALAIQDAGLADCIIEVTFQTFAATQGVVFRESDASNYWRLTTTANDYRLWKYVASVWSLESTLVLVPQSGDVVRVYLNGNSITFTVNGANATTVSDSFNATATAHGLSSGSTVARWNNYRVYDQLSFGRIDELLQHPEPGIRTTEIKCLGRLSMLRGKRVSTQLYSSITTDTALGYILDAAGLTDTTLRVLDTGKTTLDWWWLDDEDAFDAVVALVNTEGPGAALYEDGRGRVNFESRHYRLLTTRSLSSQATISDTGSEPLHSRPLRYDPGDKSIINICTVTTKTRTAKTSAAIWSLGSSFSLGPNEVRKYIARQSDDTPFTTAIAPVSPTDYTVTAGSLASVTLDRTSGASCTITLTAGASGATLSGLQLRAQTVSVDNTIQIANTISTSASQTAYGVKTYTLPVRAEIPALDAQDFCNAVVQHYRAPRSVASVTLNNGEPERLTQILSRRPSDLVTLVEGQTGINGTFWVERVEHVISAGGAVHRCQLGCEKTTGDQYWVLGDAVYGLLGETTYVGY